VSGVDPGIRLARLAQALGHPARVTILHFLRRQASDATCAEIVSQLPLAQSTVSRHLRVLVEAGLVAAEAAPPRVRYRIDPRGLTELKRLMAAL
jgi:ArsR family transcriptional regulator